MSEDEAVEIRSAIQARRTEIVGNEVGEGYDEEADGSYLLYDPQRSALAREFFAVARGEAVPFAADHEAYLKTTTVKARTTADDVRSIKLLATWCAEQRVPPTLQAISRKTAVRFMDGLGKMTGLHPRTQNKYLNRLSRYWAYLVKRELVETNIWAGLAVSAPKTEHREEERAFTDTEVQALLSGPAPQKLRDVMMIGALTGARLDPIVDLKVRDTVDGCFTFKPQKKEASARDVPIHPDLREIVARRTKGRGAEDDLFPDWPAPRKAGSKRERSFKTSNAFTKYRRDVGVNEIVEGKRSAHL